LKGNGHDLRQGILPGVYLEGLTKLMGNSQVIGNPPEIQTKYTPNKK